MNSGLNLAKCRKMEARKKEKQKLISSMLFPFLFLLIIWGVKGFELLNDTRFSHYGVFPRTLEGLKGIVFYPLIHGDLNHLLNNSLPVFLLLSSIFYFYKNVAFKVFFWTYFMSGLWIWAAARPSYHIGASGLIYGFAGFVFMSGILRKNLKLMALSMLVVFLYGGMVWGVFPIQPQISWEGHLFGALAGILLAFYYRGKGPQRKKYSWEMLEEGEEEEVPDWWYEAHGIKKEEDKDEGQPQIKYIYRSKKAQEQKEE